MNSYSVDFEEGEIREYAPAPILSSIAADWDHQRYARDASRYFDRDDDDDDSIRSSLHAAIAEYERPGGTGAEDHTIARCDDSAFAESTAAMHWQVGRCVHGY